MEYWGGNISRSGHGIMKEMEAGRAHLKEEYIERCLSFWFLLSRLIYHQSKKCLWSTESEKSPLSLCLLLQRWDSLWPPWNSGGCPSCRCNPEVGLKLHEMFLSMELFPLQLCVYPRLFLFYLRYHPSAAHTVCFLTLHWILDSDSNCTGKASSSAYCS